MKTSNVKSRKQRGFAAAGWVALHRAILDRGAEVDYYPPDSPAVKTISYVDAGQYRALVGQVLELASIDLHHYGCRSTLIARAVWCWVSETSQREIPEQWRIVLDTRSWTALLVAFKEWADSEEITVDGPRYTASDLRSVVKFGYWLFHYGKLPSCPPVAAIVWGLAFIGAAWDIKRRCGRCQVCFRQARPGEAHCDFHSQSTAIDLPRSVLYQRYRRGRLARELALQDSHIAPLLFGSRMDRHIDKRLALPDVLFPFELDDDGSSAHSMLIQTLEIAPRVVAIADIDEFHTIPYKTLVERLRQAIDPNNWSDVLWEVRVIQAEHWLEFEERVSPGVRGKGGKTSAMVGRAIELASFGQSKGQIAATLGVTPSAVSQWIRRYPDFRQSLTATTMWLPNPSSAV